MATPRRIFPTCTLWRVCLLCVAVLSASSLGATELPGVLLHAERFVGNAKVVQEASAFGGKAVRGTRWYYFCMQVPFPQGEGDYHVYVRAKTEGTDNPVQLGALNQGRLKILAAVPSPAPGRWTWVKFPPLRAKAVGPWFALHGGGQAASQWTLLDGIVIARQPAIPPEILDRAMRAVPSQSGLLTARRAAPPPIVDGLLDDACYASVPEAFLFLRLGQPRFADAQTRVSAAWDAGHLYLAARMDDPVLDPAANRLGDFRRRVRQKDGPVWTDDCFEVFLDPTCEGRDYYHFAVNALGTVYDARLLDKEFDSGAVAKARVAEGYWSVELSIPLRSLGIRPPSRGLLLGINFARQRYGDKEVSSWSPVTRFAEPEAFGRIALVDAVDDGSQRAGCGVRLGKSELFRFGENLLSFAAAGQGHVTAFAEARVERGKPVRAAVAGAVGEGRPPLELQFSLAESGRSTVQLLLIDDASAMPAYRSPLYPGEVSGAVAEVVLKGDGRLELFSNSEPAAAPAEKELSAKVPLVDGLNALAVRSSSPLLSGHLHVGCLRIPVDSTWRWAPDPDAISKTLDLDASQRVAVDAAAVRAPARGGAFRKSVAVKTTRAWPNYGEALYLAQDAAQWFHVKLQGIRGLPAAKKPVVVVDVPEGIELIDGAGYYGKNRTQQPRFSRENRGTVTREGTAYQRTAFRADRPLRTIERVGVLNLFSVVVRARGGLLRPGSPARVFYHLEDCDGAIVEVPNALVLRIAEPLRGVQPRGITLQCWPGWLSRYDGEAGKEALLDTIRRAGFNDVVLGEEGAAVHRHGMRMTAMVNFEPWVLDLAPYVKSHPAEALIDAKGEPSPRHTCTTQLLGAAWDEFVDPAIGRWVARLAPDHVNWDYESSAFTGYLACYDARCLAAFRQFARIAADVPLSPERIAKDHRGAWIDFMAERSSQIARRFRQSLKRHRPAALFSMYSGYQCAETKEIYNVDWSLCAPHLDLVMCGYGRRIEEVAATRRAAGRTPCVFGSITHPYDFNEDGATTVIRPAEVLRRLCDARGGVLYYDLSNGDARTLSAFAKVSRVAAEAEEFFVKGVQERSEFQVIRGSAGDVYVFSLGARKLLCLINETLAAAQFEIACPGTPRGLFSKAILSGKRLTANVPGGEIGVFLIDGR